MSIETPFFRVRWTLRPIGVDVTQSPKRHPLRVPLRRSPRRDADGPAYMPEGLLLDAPEQCRDRYERAKPSPSAPP